MSLYGTLPTTPKTLNTPKPLLATPDHRRLIAWGLTGAAVSFFLAGAATGLEPGAADRFEPMLVVLIRFMAGIKLAMALGAFALAQWRVRHATAPLALTYGFATCVMLASPGLIWSLAHIGLGALLFHAGLLLFVYAAWKDDSVASVGLKRPLKAPRSA